MIGCLFRLRAELLGFGSGFVYEALGRSGSLFGNAGRFRFCFRSRTRRPVVSLLEQITDFVTDALVDVAGETLRHGEPHLPPASGDPFARCKIT